MTIYEHNFLCVYSYYFSFELNIKIIKIVLSNCCKSLSKSKLYVWIHWIVCVYLFYLKWNKCFHTQLKGAGAQLSQGGIFKKDMLVFLQSCLYKKEEIFMLCYKWKQKQRKRKQQKIMSFQHFIVPKENPFVFVMGVAHAHETQVRHKWHT